MTDLSTAFRNKLKQTFRSRTKLPLIICFSILILFVIGVLAWNVHYPITYTMYTTDTIYYEKGTVASVLFQQLEDSPDMPGRKLGEQQITVRLKNGEMKGKEIEITNYLTNTHNVLVKNGQHVIIKADRPEGIEPHYSLYNYDRTRGLLTVTGILSVFMLLIGRMKGLRSVLGLAISLFFIIAFMLPAIYHGYSPVLVTILSSVLIAFFCLLLLNGFSLKTFVALGATTIGLLLSGLFFTIISAAMSLQGYHLAEAEELILISRATRLQIGQVLFSGVILASLGAVMDMTISISAALYELMEQQPKLSLTALFRSGMSIGSDMIGSMCQTLMLAFAGTSIATLLTVISYGTRFDQLMSSDYIAIEIVHSITGSLSVITAVPLTVGLVVLSKKLKNKTV